MAFCMQRWVILFTIGHFTQSPDPYSGPSIVTLNTACDVITALTYSPSGDRLAIGCFDGHLKNYIHVLCDSYSSDHCIWVQWNLYMVRVEQRGSHLSYFSITWWLVVDFSEPSNQFKIRFGGFWRYSHFRGVNYFYNRYILSYWAGFLPSNQPYCGTCTNFGWLNIVCQKHWPYSSYIQIWHRVRDFANHRNRSYRCGTTGGD